MSFRPPLAAPAPQPHSRLRHVLEAGQAGRLASSQAATGAGTETEIDKSWRVVWDAKDVKEVQEMWKSGGPKAHLKFHIKVLAGTWYEDMILEMRHTGRNRHLNYPVEIMFYNREDGWRSAATAAQPLEDFSELEEWVDPKDVYQEKVISALLSGAVPKYYVHAVDYIEDGKRKPVLRYSK